MGKRYLTVRKRRCNERNVLAAKKQNTGSSRQELCSLLLYKYGDDKSKQQSNEDMLSCPSGNDERKDHNEMVSSSNSSDSDSSQDHSENCEQCDKDVSLDSSSFDSSNAAESEADQNLSSMINLDPDCCRRSLVDLEQTNWTFSFHALELPDINSVGVDREVMTIHPVSDPFHYMSIPVLSAFGLVFKNTLEELRYSYMNLMQTLNETGRWFMLPSDGSIIQLCKHNINSASAPVITLTLEIHHSCRWFLRHSTGVILQNEHPVLATLPDHLHSGHDIRVVTDTIDQCRQCKGTDDPKFYCLVVKNKGKFYDLQGTYIKCVDLCTILLLTYYREEVDGIL